MYLIIILSLLSGLAIAFFALMNTDVVVLNYYFGDVHASVAVIVLVSAILGALFIGLLAIIKQVRTGLTIWDYQNKHQRLSKEVDLLKEQRKDLTDKLSFLQAEYDEIITSNKEEKHQTVVDPGIEETLKEHNSSES